MFCFPRTIPVVPGKYCRDLPLWELLLCRTVQRSGPEERTRWGCSAQSMTQRRCIIGEGTGRPAESASFPTLPQELHVTVCIHMINASVWSGGSGRHAERKSSFTRNNEEMTHDHTNSARFRFERLLVVGCHHTSSCLLSVLLTC